MVECVTWGPRQGVESVTSYLKLNMITNDMLDAYDQTMNKHWTRFNVCSP